MLLLPAFLFFFVDPPAEVLDQQIKNFTEALVKIQENAADPVSVEQAMYQGAIPGMLRRLDPHSVFFDPQQFEQLKQMEKSVQKGFGTVVSVLPGRVIVLQVMPGSPSAKAGLSAGDEIIAINDYTLARLEMEQLIELLGAARQHTIRLDIRRQGNARLLPYILTPADVDSPSVDRAYLLRPGVGYVRVASFEEKTAPLVRESIEKLGGNALKGLVLDLRNNPGGLLPAALEISSMFLQPGQKILSVKGRRAKGEEADVPATAKPYQFPVAVLVNGKSASASEIVAGSLQDHDRAVILGEPSYGKGLVQSVFPLSAETGLALTTAFYYTPSGRSIQHPLRGGQLDESTTANREEVRRDYRTDKGRIVKGGGGITPDRIVLPEAPTRLRAVIESTASFTNFATDYVGKHKIEAGYELPSSALDEFRVFLSERRIQPGVAEWSAERDWIRNRLKQEIVTIALGVEKGDEIEAQRDPVVQAALTELKVL